MNQEKTKHKFHEVLRWVADGETIEYFNALNAWVTVRNQDVLDGITCAGDGYNTERSRIKPKHKALHVGISGISHSYGIYYEKSTFSVFNIKESMALSDLFSNEERVVILSEECYNELVSCKEQLDKLTLTKGN